MSYTGTWSWVALAGVGLMAAMVAGSKSSVEEVGSAPSTFLMLPGDIPQPRVALALDPLADDRWRLHIDAHDFTFSRDFRDVADAVAIGHAQVVVNGVKSVSAFDSVVEIGPLPPGHHDVTVVLRGQDERALLGRHGLIKAEAVLAVPEG